MIDVDATLIGAHTEKEGAAVNFKGGFGFHPLLAYLDEQPRGAGRDAAPRQRRRRTAPPIRSRCSSRRSSSSRATVVADLDTEIVLRTDSAGSALALCQAARDARIGYLVGFDLTKQVRRAILLAARDAWRPALRQNGEERDGAQVAEITRPCSSSMTGRNARA